MINNNYEIIKDGKNKSVRLLLKNTKVGSTKYLLTQYVDTTTNNKTQFGSMCLNMNYTEIKDMVEKIIEVLKEFDFRVSPAQLLDLGVPNTYPLIRFKKGKDGNKTNVLELSINNKGAYRDFFVQALEEEGVIKFKPISEEDKSQMYAYAWDIEVEIKPFTSRTNETMVYVIVHRIVKGEKVERKEESTAFAEFFKTKTRPMSTVSKVDENIDF